MGLFDKFKKKDDFGDLLKEPVDGGWNNDSFGSTQLGGSSSSFGGDSFGIDPSAKLGSNAMPSDFGSQNPMGQQSAGSSNFNSSMDDDDFDNDVMGLPGQGHHESSHTSASPLNLNTNYPNAQSSQNQRQNEQPYYNRDNNHQSNNIVGSSQDQHYSQQHQTKNDSLTKQDVELIMTKLDLIRSTLLHLDSRISNIEQKIYEEKKW